MNQAKLNEVIYTQMSQEHKKNDANSLNFSKARF